MTPSLAERVARWRIELERLVIVPRWGDTRRFHSDSVRIARRQWLIAHIADAETRAKAGDAA